MEEDLDPLDQIISHLDWDKCAKKVDITKSTDLARVVDLFDRSDHLVQRFQNAKVRARRDAFVSSLVSALKNATMPESISRLETRLQEGALFEKCLHTLVKTLPRTAPGMLPPERHAWALMERLALEQKQIEAQLLHSMKKAKRLYDPFTFMAEGDDGTLYRPDVMLGRLSDVTASSLTMLAITNGWLDEDGLVVLPERSGPPTEQEVFAVGITEYMGHAFDAISFLVERWRFWGGEVSARDGSVVGIDGSPQRIDSVAYAPRFESVELWDHVATERLNRYIIENLSSLDFEGSVDARVPPVGAQVAPAPLQYVSKDEAFTVVALSSLLHLNVLEDLTGYGGLTLREWIRGYAWLRARLPTGEGNVEVMSEDSATDELGRVGVSADSARTFLRRTALHRGRTDLFDTPLVRIQGERLGYHPGLLRVSNLPRIILSRLSSLGVTIAGKGAAFEKATLDLLTKAGLPAKGFEFKRDGATYQYDAAFVWDGTLFVCECKSYSVPMTRPMQLFWFVEKMGDAVDQVKRLGTAAQTYPDEVSRHLGDKPWTSVVTCVVNSLPWSLGRLDNGTFILDYSTIGKFLSERTLSLKIPIDLGAVRALVRHHVKEFWPESGPTPGDFLRAMETPWQLQTLSRGFRPEEAKFLLSETLMCESVFLKRLPSDMVADLGGIGVPDPTPELEAIHKEIAKLRASLKARDARGQKVKRTAPKDKPPKKRKKRR